MTMFFWTGAAQVAAKMETMRAAEAQLVSFARRFGGRDHGTYSMELFDTDIPSTVLPLKKQPKDNRDLVMHGIRVVNSDDTDGIRRTSTPLVLLHGYMNGALYFYRNLVGFTRYFQTVYSLDFMGWGLSSRPNFALRDDSVEAAEDFFVESLEAWRAKNKIEKMTLAGHSMGGYLSVAYSEKYPERVDKLILLSPVGVPERDETAGNKRFSSAPLGRRLFFSFCVMMFEKGSNPSSFLRALPESRSRSWISSYVEHRLPAISQQDERTALMEYLHTNTMLPGSGEYALNAILHADAFAKKPTIHRIPKLKVPQVSFLYGEQDWMDSNGGLEAQKVSRERRKNGESAPSVEVFSVKDAGHLLMLDNWEEFNSAVITAGGGEHTLPSHAPLPSRLVPTVEKQWAEELLAEEASVRQTVQVQA